MKSILVLWLAVVSCILAGTWAYDTAQSVPDYVWRLTLYCWLSSAAWSALTRPWR